MMQFELRYWDEGKQEMVYSKDWGNLGCSQLKILASEGKLMQHIGIVSMDKKPIYEGDYVKVYNTYKEEMFWGVVEFKNAKFVIKMIDLTTHYRWINYEIEIIGNVYQDNLNSIRQKNHGI